MNEELSSSDHRKGDAIMGESTDSPFNLFSQPKLELLGEPLPTAGASSTKARFEPKVKPRGQQAKARIAKTAALPPKAVRTFIPNPKPDVLNEDHPYAAQPAVRVKVDIPNSNVKIEPNVEVKVEIPNSNVKIEPNLETEVEPQDMELEKVESAADHSLDTSADSEYFGADPPELKFEDRVVREIDVFLSRSLDSDTELYLLQYPLRPAWRPYNLEDQCQEVRVKAKQKKLEVDLVVDTYGDNYDQEAAEHLKIKKQTLTCLRTSLTTSYAIGILRGNKLYLNPLQAAVQLRPSMKYLDVEGENAQKKKQNTGSAADGDEEMADAEASEAPAELVQLQVNVRRRETEWQEENRLHSHAYLKQLDDAEPWVPLEPHGTDSPLTDSIRHKMMTSASSPIPFTIQRDEYIKRLVPGHGVIPTGSLQADSGSSAGFSRSFLDTLPLENRFQLLLSKGRVQVLQFERLMKLAPKECTEQEVINVLKEKAVLVQGCWVAASNLRYSRPTSVIRDYLLLLFTKNRVVHNSQLEDIQVAKETLREILLTFAVQSGVTACWEFQESTDRSFIKRHQNIVKEQAQRWVDMENSLKTSVKSLQLIHVNDAVPMKDSPLAKKGSHQPVGIQRSASAAEKGKAVHFADVVGGPIQIVPSVEVTGRSTFSEASLAALPGALYKIFLKHNVCRMQLICQSLREMAIQTASTLTSGASKKAIEEAEGAKAAAQAASAPLPELEKIVSKIASNIDGAYFLTSLASPSMDPFRNVVIALLRAKGATTGLRKTDIMEASKIALKSEVSQIVYQKVLKELCYSRGGTWVMKPGDGRPT